jgi:protein pelota
LLLVMDDEEAELAFLSDRGLDQKARVIAGKSGKRYESNEKGNKYFDEITNAIKNLEAERIVVAGPGFEKEKFKKFLSEKNEFKKISYESTNSVGITGLNELVKSGKIDRLIENYHSAEEASTIEKILKSIGNNEAAIGFSETEKTAETGAIETIAISENALSEQREKAEKIIELADKQGAKIIFVNPKSDSGKQLEGLGGIAAKLRYKIR